MRNYAAFTTLVTQKLQSSGTADFSVSEVDNAIEEGLKEFSHLARPHIFPLILPVESRYGTCSSTSVDNLRDTTKGQFLSGDATNEKVVHNRTDNTYAVVLSFSSTAQIGISRDIFVVNDNYRIYNKRCTNKKQLFIGDMPDHSKIDSVEYPIGEKRNWEIIGEDILELKVDSVEDSNASSTVTDLPNVDVLIRFVRPHVLSQLTDWAGTFAATAAAGATTLSGSTLQSAGTIEIGEEFHVENHKSRYIVTAATTIASNTAAITFYPGLESAVAATTWTFTFTQSSLLQNEEETFADLVAARLAINKAPKFFNAINLGGGQVWQNFQTWGERRLSQVMKKIQSETPPKVKHLYTRE